MDPFRGSSVHTIKTEVRIVWTEDAPTSGQLLRVSWLAFLHDVLHRGHEKRS